MKKILAIDDNNDNLISLKAIVMDAFPDMTIYTALNGPEGIELALVNDPDVILLDILMPGMDGFEVCRMLKRDDRLRDIPVVFLTAIKQSRQSRIEALEIGAEAFLSKPIDVLELTAQIRAMVKIKDAHKQRQNEKERLARLVAERTSELEKSHREMIKLLADLKSSEVRYRRLFESASDGILIVDAESGMMLDVNQSLATMLNVAADQLIGCNIAELGERFGVSVACYEFEKLRKIGFNSIEDLVISTADNKKRHVEVFCNAYEADSLKAFQCNIRDITKRIEAEEQAKTLGKAIEQGPSSIVITNGQGEIEFVNNKFTELTQYKLEEVRGRRPRIFNPGHLSPKKEDSMWNVLQKDGLWKGEFLNRKKDHSMYWEDVVISVLTNSNNTICNYVLIMNDISEKKQMLDVLIKAKEKAEEADRLKSAFLANMSHEIRTPLNCIIGFSDLMLDQDFDTGKMEDFAQMINTSGVNMLSMINDILDISKIEAGQLCLKKSLFSVNQLVCSVRDEYAYNAKTKGLELTLDPLCPETEIFINNDGVKLKQVLINLIGNAIKFSKDGAVEIGFRTKKDSIQFHVKDNGIGIPKDYQKKVFERFIQVESDYTREYGGNGLGLAISKSFVELWGGNIWVESEVDKGSTFCFTIPKK